MKRNNEEHQIQAGIIAAVEHIPECRWLHAIPNGGARNVVTGKMLKAEGVKRGIADLHLPWPVSNVYENACGDITEDHKHGLYIEVKTPKGRLTPEQIEFMDFVESRGYQYHVVRSVQEGVDCILSYLGKK